MPSEKKEALLTARKWYPKGNKKMKYLEILLTIVVCILIALIILMMISCNSSPTKWSQSDGGIDGDSNSDTDTNSDMETDTETNTESNTDTESETESGTNTETETETDTDSTTESTDTGTDTATEMEVIYCPSDPPLDCTLPSWQGLNPQLGCCTPDNVLYICSPSNVWGWDECYQITMPGRHCGVDGDSMGCVY